MRLRFGAKIRYQQTSCQYWLKFLTNFVFSPSEMASNAPTDADEVSRVNKLLQIEDLVWRKQLEKAVSGFHIILISPSIQTLFLGIFLIK